MKKIKLTAKEAAKDFVTHVWPTLFIGNRKGSFAPYSKIRAFVTSVEKGTESEEYTIRVLKEYGGDRYDIIIEFEIKQPESVNPDLATPI